MKTTTTKTTFNPLEEIKNLMEKRNALVIADSLYTMEEELAEINSTICEKMADLAVKKTLSYMQNNPSRLPSSALNLIDNMLIKLPLEKAILRTWNLNEIFGDTIPLYDLAYFTVYNHIKNPIILKFEDTVYTKTKKNGEEKNYNLYEYAKLSVFRDINEWSKSNGADLLKMYYLLGYDDNGKQITTSSKKKIKEINPDTLEDITENKRIAFLKKYKFTDRQLKIALLLINGKKAFDISEELKINLRMAQREIKEIKFIMSKNNPYIKE